MKKFLLFTLVLPYFLLANNQKYTISICTTINLENALICKKNTFEKMDGTVFIVKEDNKFYTYLNIYEDKELAKVTIKHSSQYVKEQKPYIKEISDDIVSKIDKRKLFIDMDSKEKNSVQEEFTIKKDSKELEDRPKTQAVNIPIVSMLPENLEILGTMPYAINDEENSKNEEKNPMKKEYLLKSQIDFGNENENISQDDEEELLQVSLDEFDAQTDTKKQEIKKSYEKSIKKPLASKNEIKNLMSYDEIIIKVNQQTNIMELFAKEGNKEISLKKYIISSGKNDIKKPFGEGRISQISLNPTWYPTTDTKKSFAKKGIILPDVVPPNHKYNYMGMAKLNLTHSVDGNTTYRIHGTLNEKTLGRNESAGCIRMKNSDVVELATLLEEFAELKSLNKIRVILI